MLKQKKDEFERGSGGRERALWISVIQQAIEDYNHDPLISKNANSQRIIRNLADKAKYWLFISKLETMGSLAWICNELEIPIENIRKKIKEPYHANKFNRKDRMESNGATTRRVPMLCLPRSERERDSFYPCRVL